MASGNITAIAIEKGLKDKLLVLQRTKYPKTITWNRLIAAMYEECKEGSKRQ